MVRLLFLLALSTVLLLFSALSAAQGEAIDDVRIGLGGRYKLGHWTPVWIELNAPAESLQGDLRIETPDGDDLWAAYTGGSLANVEVPAGQRQTVLGYVRVGRTGGSLVVRLTAGDGKRVSRIVPLEEFGPAITSGEQRVVIIGDSIGMDKAQRYLPRRPGEQLVSSLIENANDLPDRWYGYDGVDLLVLTTGRPELYEQLSHAQREAIITWVELGGRLMMTVGANGQQVLQTDGLLASLAPGEWQSTVPLRATSPLENLAESPNRLDEPIDDEPPLPVMLTQLRSPQGQVLLSGTGGSHLILQSVRGFGYVQFVGFDLDARPIADWADRGRLLARTLEFALSRSEPSDDSRHGDEAAQLGFDDISGQLRAALDQFTGVRVVPFSLIAGLMIIYILLIGPGDYFLLKKVIGRMELTWLTFVVTAVAFGAVAWWLTGRVRSSETLVNQVDVVDVDLDSSLVRGTTWLRLYSPRSDKLDLSLHTSPSEKLLADRPGMLFGWQGLPGNGLGGMDDKSRLSVGGPSYEINNTAPADEPPQLEIDALPVADSATKGLLARWWAPADLDAQYELRYNRSNLLEGTVVNPLNVRLTGCVLYHERWAYILDTLEPGQETSITKWTDQGRYLNVQWMLTDRNVREGREKIDRWDHAMREDMPKLVRMMMFHEAAGGRAHTGLLHRYHGYIDLSSHLPLQRAVLLGRAESPATMLASDGQPIDSEGDKHWTFYRVIFKTTPAE